MRGAEDPSAETQVLPSQGELDEDIRAGGGASQAPDQVQLKTRNVEVRTCKDTEDVTLLQKAADFVKVKLLIVG